MMDFNGSARRPTILLPNMGEGDLPDNEAIKRELETLGAEVVSTDIAHNGNLRHLAWDKIDVIDLRNMRGSLTNYTKYMSLVERIQDKVESQARKGHNIKVLPGYEEILWIAPKANYMPYVQENGIETIPTQIITRHSDSQRPSVTDADSLDQAVDQTMEYINTRDAHRYVVKPSISSLAKNLIFIERQEGGYKIEIPHERTSDFSDVMGEAELRQNLRSYFNFATSPDEAFLVQDFVENLETSAVFVNGIPHYIERTCGSKSIAHARYGGKDTLVENPEPALVEFVNKVRDVLPENVRSSPFLRIDVMKDTNTGEYIFSEIEGAGAIRLWLEEAGRVQEYASLLVALASEAQPEYVPVRVSIANMNDPERRLVEEMPLPENEYTDLRAG